MAHQRLSASVGASNTLSLCSVWKKSQQLGSQPRGKRMKRESASSSCPATNKARLLHFIYIRVIYIYLRAVHRCGLSFFTTSLTEVNLDVACFLFLLVSACYLLNLGVVAHLRPSAQPDFHLRQLPHIDRYVTELRRNSLDQ